ncbi:hypothetical protein BX283_4964 [Streptomyces sp. TLI_146]|nr:hypothetical protein BX283_4964 [Streptomyces sp. TLI_146]
MCSLSHRWRGAVRIAPKAEDGATGGAPAAPGMHEGPRIGPSVLGTARGALGRQHRRQGSVGAAGSGAGGSAAGGRAPGGRPGAQGARGWFRPLAVALRSDGGTCLCIVRDGLRAAQPFGPDAAGPGRPRSRPLLRVTGLLSPADRSRALGRGPTTCRQHVTRPSGATRGFFGPAPGWHGHPDQRSGAPAGHGAGRVRLRRIRSGPGTAPASSSRARCRACPARRGSGRGPPSRGSGSPGAHRRRSGTPG